MEKKFDLVVIGTGSAGSTVAHKCRKAGWNVAIVDSRPFGSTCALHGCDPKKVLDLKTMIYAYPTSASDISYRV